MRSSDCASCIAPSARVLGRGLVATKVRTLRKRDWPTARGLDFQSTTSSRLPLEAAGGLPGLVMRISLAARDPQLSRRREKGHGTGCSFFALMLLSRPTAGLVASLSPVLARSLDGAEACYEARGGPRQQHQREKEQPVPCPFSRRRESCGSRAAREIRITSPGSPPAASSESLLDVVD